MSNMIRNGIRYLNQKRIAHMSDTVQYYHNGNMVPIAATFGRTEFETMNSENNTIGARVWDFLIDADALGFEPKRGDYILYGSDKYEVTALGQDVNGWRWSDPYQVTYRIHTTQVAA
jgi:hypothetical protein